MNTREISLFQAKLEVLVLLLPPPPMAPLKLWIK